MQESSGSQFLGITTGIQSRPDAFDKLKFIMTSLTILEVTEICCFRLVLQARTDKAITELSRLELLEKFSANNFLYPMQKTTPLGH